MAYSSRLELVIDSRSGEQNLRRMERSLNRTERAGDDTADSMGGINSELGRMRGVALAASGALAGLFGAMGAQEVIRYSDAWTDTSNLLRQVTDTTAELTQKQRELMGVANESRSSYESTVSLYTRLAKSTTELGISEERLLTITEAINKSFAVSGASAEESAGAIRQLAQGLAAGALRGDEFNSVAENAPEIMDAIANSLNMTRGELRDFAAEGGITSQVIIDAMESAADSIDKTFGDAIASFSQKLEVSQNNLLAWVGASDELNSAVGVVGDAVVGLSGNIDTLVDGAQILATVIAGRLAGSFATATAAQLAATQQSIAYQAALARMAGVSRTAATAQLAMGAAVRSASAAMAIVGGPAGVAVLAAAAIFAYRDELGMSIPTIDASSQAVDQLTGELKEMSRAAAEAKLTELTNQMADLKAAAEGTGEAIMAVGRDDGGIGGSLIGSGTGGLLGVDVGAQAREIQQITEAAKPARQEMANVEEAINLVKTRLEQLNGEGENTPPVATNIADALSDAQREAEKFESSLQSLLDDLYPLQANLRQYQEEQLLLNQAHAQGKISADQYAESLKRLNEQRMLSDQRPDQAYDILSGPSSTGVGQQDQSGWDSWLESAQTAFTDFDAMAANTAENFQRGFGQAFESMIFDSQSFGDSMYSLFDGIARTLVQSLGEMAAQWVAYQAVQMLAGKTAQASAATTQAANAQAMSQMAGLNAYSSTAAIPIVGPVLAPGAMAAAIAATQPVAASVAAMSFAGMAHDGIDSVPQDGTWLLQKGERVTTADTSAKLDRTLNDVQRNRSGGSGEVTVNVTNSGQPKQASARTRMEDGKMVIDILLQDLEGSGRYINALQGRTNLQRRGS